MTNYLSNVEYRVLGFHVDRDEEFAPLVQLATDTLLVMRTEVVQLIDFLVAALTVRRGREAFWGVRIKFHALHASWTHHVSADSFL